MRSWMVSRKASTVATHQSRGVALPVCRASVETRWRWINERITAPGAAAGWIKGIEDKTGGPVAVLVCNAGGVRGQVMRPVDEVPDEDWHAIFDINAHAAFKLAKAVAPGMKRAKAGRIVTISSGAGLKPSKTGIQA